MLAVWWWVRADLRRRWASLVVLGLLVALAGGVVLASVAGARRTGTALERLRSASVPADVAALPNQAGFDWEAVRRLPSVETLGEFAVTTFTVVGFGQSWVDEHGLSTFPPASSEMTVEIERGVLRAGRWPDPTRPDEVVVAPGADELGIEIGDQLQLQTFDADRIDEYLTAGALPAADGPVQDVTVVGVAKGSFFLGDETSPVVMPTVAFTQRYWDNLVGDAGHVNALIRLAPGTSVEQFGADLERLAGRPVELMDINANDRRTNVATDLERNALLAFAAAAGIAAIVLVGQALVRLVTVSAADLPPLRAIGFDRRQSAAALAAGPVAAGALGALGAVVLAWGLSAWFPIGIGRRIEPFPGRDFDAAVLVPGGLAVLLMVLTAVALVAAFASRARAGTSAAARRSWLANLVGASGAAVPVVLGARLALEPGRGRSAVPVRPALIGAVAGVIGVVGAFTFRAGVDRATNDTALFGQSWDAETILADGATAAALVDDPNIAAVNDTRMVVLDVNGRSVTSSSIIPLKGDVDIAMLEGRAPETDDEIALAPVEQRALGLDVGDEVMVNNVDGAGVRYRIVGVGFTPNVGHTSYVDGAWITGEGQQRVAPGLEQVKFRGLVVDFGADVDADAAIQRLAEQGIPLTPTALPEDGMNLRGVRNVPLGLGAFLALLAIAAVGHALASAVRRRRRDVAILRVLGLTRRQARACVGWQATTLALVGLVIGVPVGIAIGRALWRSVAIATPFVYVAPLAVIAVIAVWPATIALANALAALPARRAARLRPAEVLRAE